jgi:Family of unknown function (DUF6364)
MRQKLTVRLPKDELDFLKGYAAAHDVTATEVIDRYLRRLKDQTLGEIHPDVQRFTGLVPAAVDAEGEWRDHQAEKHR